MKYFIFILLGLLLGAVGYWFGFDRGETQGKAEAAAEFYVSKSEAIPENPIEKVGYSNPFSEVTINPFAE